MFWLSYESFSILSNSFCQKVSFPAKTVVTELCKANYKNITRFSNMLVAYIS